LLFLVHVVTVSIIQIPFYTGFGDGPIFILQEPVKSDFRLRLFLLFKHVLKAFVLYFNNLQVNYKLLFL